jgi:hypothetical protein
MVVRSSLNLTCKNILEFLYCNLKSCYSAQLFLCPTSEHSIFRASFTKHVKHLTLNVASIFMQHKTHKWEHYQTEVALDSCLTHPYWKVWHWAKLSLLSCVVIDYGSLCCDGPRYFGHTLTLNWHLTKPVPSERRELQPYNLPGVEILSHLKKSDLVEL